VDAQGKKTTRMFVLVPSDTEDEYDFYGFYLQGKFRVVEKVNNPKLAFERFKAFVAE